MWESLTKMPRNCKFEELHAYLRAYGNRAVTKSPYVTLFIGKKIVSIKDCRERNKRIMLDANYTSTDY
jgi:hypothetical protein